jgi:hypothetical protein
MKDIVKLPTDYKPFKNLIICSNLLENGRVPISISGDIPFLVGKGKYPKVWINMLAQKEVGKIHPLVRDNMTLHKQVNVVEINNSTEIKSNNTLILKAIKHSEEEAEIVALDLRIIGINIFGDTNGLHVGPQVLSKNSFVNVDCMIGLDSK